MKQIKGKLDKNKLFPVMNKKEDPIYLLVKHTAAILQPHIYMCMCMSIVIRNKPVDMETYLEYRVVKSVVV